MNNSAVQLAGRRAAMKAHLLAAAMVALRVVMKVGLRAAHSAGTLGEKRAVMMADRSAV